MQTVAQYKLTMNDPFGRQIAESITFQTFSASRRINQVGPFSVVMGTQFCPTGITSWRDYQFELWRKPDSSMPWSLFGDTVWLVRYYRRAIIDGEDAVTFKGFDALNLIDRRWIPYAAGSSQALKAATVADDLIKTFVKENLGSSVTDPLRDWSSYFSVQANLSLAPSVDKAVAYRKLLPVLQEVAQSSFQLGTYLAFDMVRIPQASPNLEFRTFINQRGQNHSWQNGGTAPVVFSPELGNVSSIERVIDYTNEATYAYTPGQGIEAARVVGTASADSSIIGASPFGRVETLRNATSTDNQTILDNEAKADIRANQVKDGLTADVTQTPATQYDVHYKFGDIVTLDWDGVIKDVRVDYVAVNLGQGDAPEHIDVQLQTAGL